MTSSQGIGQTINLLKQPDRNADHAGRTVTHPVPENHRGGGLLAQDSQGLEQGQGQADSVHRQGIISTGETGETGQQR